MILGLKSDLQYYALPPLPSPPPLPTPPSSPPTHSPLLPPTHSTSPLHPPHSTLPTPPGAEDCHTGREVCSRLHVVCRHHPQPHQIRRSVARRVDRTASQSHGRSYTEPSKHSANPNNSTQSHLSTVLTLTQYTEPSKHSANPNTVHRAI